MTLPYERTNAVNTTRSFLMDLINPKATPRVPRAIRQQALWCLRHYPTQYDMDVVSEKESRDNGHKHVQVFGTNPWFQSTEKK